MSARSIVVPLTRAAALLASASPGCQAEIPELGMAPCRSFTSAIGACLVNPTVSSLMLTSVPPFVLADRPLEFELTAVDPDLGAREISSVARSVSQLAHVCISVEANGCASLSAPVSLRPFGVGWIARAMLHPTAWIDAASVSVVSFTLAVQNPLPGRSLPATLRVGYNLNPSPAGPVFAAANAGSALVLKSLLDAGCSTEEAGKVRVRYYKQLVMER